MANSTLRIGVVAPSCRIEPELAERLIQLAQSLYPGRVAIRIHPQCFLSKGHFAGADDERARAFLEFANDETLDVIWFARGGYGAMRTARLALPHLAAPAGQKTYVGYSDAGALLGALYAKHVGRLLWGPMPADLDRRQGDSAVRRVLSFLVANDRSGLEPHVNDQNLTAAFNMTILGSLIGTDFEPDLKGHVLMLEEVSEQIYRVDRAMLHLSSLPSIRRVAGIRLGRVSAVPENDPPFDEDEEMIVRRWSRVAGIEYLGRADIGHDAGNKIVPFGRLT
jgi:muramoyltetrapeptide carboxypeptidase